MSKRAELKAKRKQAARRRQMAAGLIVIGLSIAAAAYLIWQQNKPLGEFVNITVTPPVLAEGKSLGRVDAPVVIEAFEDFQ